MILTDFGTNAITIESIEIRVQNSSNRGYRLVTVVLLEISDP